MAEMGKTADFASGEWGQIDGIYHIGGFIEDRLQNLTESTPIRIEINKHYFIGRCNENKTTNQT